MIEAGAVRRAGIALVAFTLMAAAPAFAGVIHVSGAGYFDYWGLTDAQARGSALSGVTPEVALKVDVDVHESFSFSGKVCFGCHGLEVDRAYFEYTPSPYVNIQAGRVPVPFGDFSQRYDPANHRTSSKPLIFEMGRMAHYGPSSFNMGVVPAPYVDTGVVVYGQVWLAKSLQLWYAGYAVAGLKGGGNSLDFASMRSLFYVDNNRAPAGGGRAALTFSSPNAEGLFKDVTLGFSAMYGRYDPDLLRAYTALGMDVSLRLGIVTVRIEAADLKMDVDPDGRYRFGLVDPFIEKSGFYAEVEHPLGSHLILVYRFDGLRRAGVPLLQSDPQLSPDSTILRYTQGLQILLTDAFFAKLSYEHWWMNDYPSFDAVHLGLGGTF